MSYFAVFLVTFTVLYGKASAGAPPAITSSATPPAVPENAAPGTVIVSVTTVMIPNAMIMIEGQMPASDPPKFNITGSDVVLHSMLDFEMTSSYMIMLKAVDSMDNMTSAMQNVTITVSDVNEPPMFMEMMYSATVENGTMADMSVITVTAMDPDAGNTIMYDIEAAGNTNMDFKINNMGNVMTDKMITGTPMAYTLTIKAMDNQSPSLTGTTMVMVNVTMPMNSAVNVMAGMSCLLMPLLHSIFL